MSTNETYGVMGFVDENGNQNIHYPISQAELITYNNASSGLKAGDTQAALDELSAALDAAKPLSGTSDPTSATKGAVGQHYTNTTTGKEFTCLAADDEHGVYTWEASGGGGGGSLVLNAIRIKTAPTKTAYKAGETFDPTGMEIVADYAMDGVVILKDQEVDDYSYPTGALAAGTTKVTISLTKNGVTKTVDQAITCTKTAVTVPAVSGTYTYNGNTQTFSFTNEPNSSIATKSGDTSGLNAGSYTTRFTLNSPDLYQWADGSTSAYKDIPVTIGVVTPTVTAPTKAADMTYNGSSRDLTATAGSTNFGTLQYSTDGTNWSTTRPKATNAGSYTVRYRVVGDSNINSVASTSIGTVTINAKAPALSVSPSSVTLNASNLTAACTITTDSDGALSQSSSDSTVATASISNKNVTVSHVNKKTGTATITISQAATANYAAATCTISVTAQFVSIYGVQWDGTTTPVLTRTDAAASFTDPVPYVAGASNYGSPFDNLAPWKDMTRVTDSEAGEMVKIPKFWYKLTQSGNTLKVQIADSATDGYSVCPACMDRGDGSGERDYVLVGRYHCAASDYKSKTGEKPKAGVAQADFRTAIHNLGSKVYMMDFATRFTIWLLYIVEFANWNSQAVIGKGCGNNSATENMGYTDSMPYHTGTTQSSRDTYGLGTQYRYLEGLWDNVYDRLTGCYNASTGLMVEVNPTKFAENSGGVSVGTPASGWIAGLTVSTSGPFPCFINSKTDGGGEAAYVCDYWVFSASHPVVYVGGNYYQNGFHGMFYVYYTSLTNTDADLGSRILKFP